MKNTPILKNIRVRYLFKSKTGMKSNFSVNYPPVGVTYVNIETGAEESEPYSILSLDTLILDELFTNVLGKPEVVEGNNIYQYMNSPEGFKIYDSITGVIVNVTTASLKSRNYKYQLPEYTDAKKWLIELSNTLKDDIDKDIEQGYLR